MGSFKFHLALLTIIALSTACNSSKSTTGSTFYEDDEVYYTPGETFITDVSNFTSSTPSTSQSSPPPVSDPYPEEDYYTENSGDGSTVNNYYGDVYQDVNGGFNTGWGSPRARLAWSPLFGWSMSYGVGWGYDPFFYDPFFYDPWAFNNGWGYNYGWGFNNGWGNPYWGGYYGYSAWNRPYGVWGGWGNSFVDNGNSNGIIYGHRPSFSTNSVSNSSYGSGTIFSGRNNFIRPASGNPASTVGSGKPSSGAVPRDPERSTSPSTTKPSRGNQTTRPADVDTPGNVNPRPGRTEPNRNPSVEPERGNGRTAPERSSPPSRNGGGSIDRGNSGGSSSPSRSGGGSSGGSRSGGGSSGGSGGGRRR